jgi:hypothetical protein
VGAVEHLKSLCCLGLPPESAMVAVVPLLHEIIPHGWTRMGLVAPDATITSTYGERPEAAALCRERLHTHLNDPTGVVGVTKRLYHNLDVHNPAELSTKIWLGQKQDEARQILWPAG